MDLQEFILVLQRNNELLQVDGADWNLEIGTITELSSERQGKALLFDRIKDYPEGYRVIVNVLDTPERWALALGLPAGPSKVELVRLTKEKFKKVKPLPPVTVKSGPLLENVDEGSKIDMMKFPAPFWHEHDGGRYIGTGDLVIMRDPEGQWVNAGTYRVQLHDEKTLGLFMSPGQHGNIIREKYFARAKTCPVAVVFGAHPLLWIPAFMRVPWGVDEFDIAGGLLERPLEVIKGGYTGLPVPAYSEIAIEGECLPLSVEARKEGPFGEATGYYGSGVREEGVIRVKRVMYRSAPVINGAPPLKPPASGSGSFIIRAANLWQSLEKAGIPGLTGVYNLRAGGSRFLTVISINQRYAGHARQLGMAALAVPESAFFGRFVILVDDDIDPSEEQDVLWALSTRCNPAESIEIIDGCWSSPLDPVISPEKRAKSNFTSSRALIDACRPYHWMKDFPIVNKASKELRARTLDKWAGLFKKN